MGNSSAFGSLARKAGAWAILAIVAILLFKMVLAIAAAVVSTLLGLVVLAAVIYAVVWAVRRL